MNDTIGHIEILVGLAQAALDELALLTAAIQEAQNELRT